MSELASVHIEVGQGVSVVVVAGEIDMATAPLLENELSAAIESGVGPVVLDLCQTSFFDSTGLRASLVAHRRLVEHGRQLAIACLPEGQVQRLFVVAGVNDLLSTHPDRAAALAAVLIRADAIQPA